MFKKISNYSLLVCLLTSLAFPAGLTLSQSNSSNLPQAINSDKTPAVNVQMVTLSQAQPIVMQVASMVAEGCKVNGKVDSNLLQDTGTINLNQPANCFSLAPIASSQKTMQQITVQPLIQAQSFIVVVDAQVKISAENFKQGTSQNQIPVIPSLELLAVTVLAVSLKNKNKSSLVQKNNSFLLGLSLNHFAVMRC